MSTENITKDSINLRLLAVVEQCAGGNVKKFAEKAHINPVTMLYYVKGRVPGTTALANICEYYNVNLNWLLAGKGSMFIGEEKESKSVDISDTESKALTLFNEWAKEIYEENADRDYWLLFELIDKIDRFKFWMRDSGYMDAESLKKEEQEDKKNK